ncbi:putative ZCF37 [Quillaja saponaria]|uniref:ZCF37 n=1 Tax=Quillaja saponaria TaxID=32244 RepID=A0AAD7PTG4_QUISA|nr:putative ZCF37 [Quillaja saponaria]
MLSTFICGTFHHEEDETWNTSPGSTPRKSRRNNSFSKSHNKDSKNPYSTRGLDTFSALLAELEEKRQKIYSQMDSQNISFVRFAYRNSKDCVPVVVKLKPEEEKINNIEVKQLPHPISKAMDKSPTDQSSVAVNCETNQPKLEAAGNKVEKKQSFSWNTIKLDKWRRPSYYLPLFIVLILVFLAVFGRSFAILCTSIGWYLVPTLKDSSRTRRSVKKKDYVRRLSEKKMVSDGISSPRKHFHQKSW